MGVNLRGLTFKLTLAFIGIALGAIVIVDLLVRQAVSAQFSAYLEVTRRHMEGATGQGMTGHMGGSMAEMMGGDMMTMMGPSEQAFISDVTGSLWLAGGLASIAALVLGFLVARQLTTPLRRLGLAAHRIAAGDLSHRLAATSGDELGDVSRSFNAMAEALGRNEELRRNQVADIAHELRTPLAVLQGHLEGMLDGVMEPSRENLTSLHEETMLLSRLVSDLRTLSLAEAGQLELHKATADPVALARQAVAAAQPHGRQVQLEAGGPFPPVQVDPERFAQIMHNLLDNALRYTPAEGKVTVSVAGDDGHVRFAVADTGPGIPPEDLPRIFERFYRGDRSRSRATGGSGLGLAIVKQLVAAHGGNVWVESQPGQGARFYFTLPRA